MPCSDGMPRDWGQQEALQRERDITQGWKDNYSKLHEEYMKRETYLSACLCALLTEITKHPVGEQFIDEAEEHGSVDIRSFWDEHRAQDIERLEQILRDTFSAHELSALQDIIPSMEV